MVREAFKNKNDETYGIFHMLVNSANRNAERLPVVVLHLLHPAVVLFVALVGFLAELSPEVGSLPETGHGRFGKSLLQIRIVSYH